MEDLKYTEEDIKDIILDNIETREQIISLMNKLLENYYPEKVKPEATQTINNIV